MKLSYKTNLRQKYIVRLLMASLLVLGMPLLISRLPNAEAASVSECIASSGAPSVPSIQNACNLCYNTSTGSRRGTLWINSGVKDSYIVTVTDPNATTVPFAMYGQVYGCQRGNIGQMNAYQIWFAPANVDSITQKDQELSFLRLYNNFVSRGSPSGPHQWGAHGVALGEIDVQAFKDVATCSSLGNGYEECRYTASINRCPTQSPWVDGTCYGDNSEIILHIPEGNPTPPRPTPDPASGDGHFWSQSKVSAVANGDVIAGIEATTDIDGEAEIIFSTDQPSVQIQFQHFLGYTNTSVPNHGTHSDNGHSHGDSYSDATTTFDIKMIENSNENTIISDTNYSHSVGSSGGPDMRYSQPITIDLEPGQTKKICQTITYSYKNFTVTENDHRVQGGTGTSAYDYTWHSYDDPKGSGSGNSYVCATVTRPIEPSGGPNSTGTADSTIMFTGEDAQIGWSTTVTSYPTRRLLGWEAVTYLVPVNEGNWQGLTTGTIGDNSYLNITGGQRNTNDTCNWYGRKGAILNCKIGNSSESSNFNHEDTMPIQTHIYNKSKQIIVPDNVGYKYCNSFGYHYAYYWYSSVTGKWTPYPGQNYNYWNIYDATCRTIAKKPSTTIWNGSLMTAGGTQATPAYRYDGANFGETANNQARTLYGSWSEFLAVIGQSTQGVASGSNLSIGSKRGGHDICNNSLSASNSTLTISNTSCGELGYSGVQNNSTYVTRLDTYLKSGASNASHYYNVPNTDDLRTKLSAEGISIDNINKTIVVHVSGDFNITQNIKTNLGPYDSIYQIPQVIIFTDGNVNISSAVTEIDAWIITPNGTVNTCSDFAQGVTEADAVGRRYDICTNQLVFNGPVLAKNLNLRRSFGSDPMITYRSGTFNTASSKQAAGEIFNLRSDVYLWGYAQAGRYDSSYTESYTRELAPRY